MRVRGCTIAGTAAGTAAGAAAGVAALALLVGVVAPTGSARAGTVVSEVESEPYPGIRLVERTEADPNNRIRVAYVSLCTDRVHVTATAPAGSLTTPGSWGSGQGVQLAVNGDFFTTGPQVYGDAVGGGMPWPLGQTGNSQGDQWYYHRYGWIAMGDGWVEFNHTERTKLDDAARFSIGLGWSPLEVTEAIPAGTQALVSGFPELVIEGQVYTCPSPTDTSCFPDRSDMRDRHPRTAMGLTEDRHTFILVAVDGRDAPASVGMYGAELATLMGELGAWEAFNLDGGGSTAMWLDGAGYVNQPSDGSARSVANHWGVFAGEAGGQPAEPGHCFEPGGCFPTALAEAQGEVFGDMPAGSVGHDEAIALLDAGVTHGCRPEPEPLFCPGCPLRRWQAAVFVVRAAGLPVGDPPEVPTFDDVAPEAPYYAELEAAVAAGVVTGCTPTSFCPQEPITRGDAVAFVRSGAGWPEAPDGAPTFDDVSEDHPRAADIEAAAEQCALEPCSPGAFCPDDPMLRADAAVVLARAFGLVPSPDCSPDDPGGTGGTGSGNSGGSSDEAGEGADGGGTSEVGTTFEGPALPPGVGEGDGNGCGCTTGPGRSGGGAGLVLLILAAGLRRHGRTAASDEHR